MKCDVAAYINDKNLDMFHAENDGAPSINLKNAQITVAGFHE